MSSRPTVPFARSWVLATAVTLLATAASVAGAAYAQGRNEIRGEVLVLLAKEEAGRVDPSLADIAALRRAPFNAFRSIGVLSRPAISLRVNRPTTVDLPNGRRLQLVLQQVMPDGRFRVRVSINRPSQNDYLPLLQVVASPGDPFFVAGQQHDGGTLVIGVRLGTSTTDRGGQAAAEKRR